MGNIVEVDEDRLKALQGAHNLLDTLMRDPKLRPYQEKLIKAKFPTTQTSEDDPRVAEMRALAGKVNKFMTDQENDKINTRLEASYSKLRNERSYTDEGIEKIKKLQIERSIADPEDAADIWEKRNPPKIQEPAGYEPASWNFGPDESDEDLKSLWADDDKWTNKQIGLALKEARQGTRED